MPNVPKLINTYLLKTKFLNKSVFQETNLNAHLKIHNDRRLKSVKTTPPASVAITQKMPAHENNVNPNDSGFESAEPTPDKKSSGPADSKQGSREETSPNQMEKSPSHEVKRCTVVLKRLPQAMLYFL